MSCVNSAAVRKIRCDAGIYHSVLEKRCAFRHRAKVTVDSVERWRSAGRLFHISRPGTAKLLRPMAVAVHCTSSLPASDVDVERPAGRAQQGAGMLGPTDI